MSLADLNWLDWLVLALLLLAALDGTRRGLLLGALDLVVGVVGLVAAFVAERSVTDGLLKVVPGFQPALAHIAVFLALLIGVQFVVGASVGRIVWMLARAVAATPLGVIDRALGVAPGLVRGVVTTTFVLLPFALLPLIPSVSQAIQDSTLANRMVAGALELMPTIQAGLGQDLEGGLPGLVVAPPAAEGETERPLPLGPPAGNLEPDPVAEQRMLDLVNRERSQAGLRPLAGDERLRQVARAHSLEMFQLDYFSHTSPTAGSPFDRMRAAGIGFVVAGENLAYAPDVETAHNGLMNSPGHRANILRPEFGRIGIGIVKSQAQGAMFTQDFTN